ncbi:MAG: hypothetical protein LBJ16_00230 [Holosporaceae bacterium]|nr:hypothetical protein [Holosporaceae bacterium]
MVHEDQSIGERRENYRNSECFGKRLLNNQIIITNNQIIIITESGNNFCSNPKRVLYLFPLQFIQMMPRIFQITTAPG